MTNKPEEEVKNDDQKPQPQAACPYNTSGLVCAYCGSPLLQPSGSCFTCMNCGETTGCS